MEMGRLKMRRPPVVLTHWGLGKGMASLFSIGAPMPDAPKIKYYS
jgi:hypothetical protein